MKKHWLSALVAGILFGVGLGVAGMTRPEKIVGFLNITGDWDPSLIFVMGGALTLYFLAHRLLVASGRIQRPLVEAKFVIPTRRDIDGPLVVGSVIFGLGWGLAGFCPGPAIVAVTSGAATAFVFVAAMVVGNVGYRLWDTRKSS
jgi:uncharacterized protein